MCQCNIFSIFSKTSIARARIFRIPDRSNTMADLMFRFFAILSSYYCCGGYFYKPESPEVRIRANQTCKNGPHDFELSKFNCMSFFLQNVMLFMEMSLEMMTLHTSTGVCTTSTALLTVHPWCIMQAISIVKDRGNENIDLWKTCPKFIIKNFEMKTVLSNFWVRKNFWTYVSLSKMTVMVLWLSFAKRCLSREQTVSS